MKEILTFCP